MKRFKALPTTSLFDKSPHLEKHAVSGWENPSDLIYDTRRDVQILAEVLLILNETLIRQSIWMFTKTKYQLLHLQNTKTNNGVLKPNHTLQGCDESDKLVLRGLVLVIWIPFYPWTWCDVIRSAEIYLGWKSG